MAIHGSRDFSAKFGTDVCRLLESAPATLCIIHDLLLLACACPSYAVTSVLAIGGIGGLAIGLAGREICENLLNGFLIMSTVSTAVA